MTNNELTTEVEFSTRLKRFMDELDQDTKLTEMNIHDKTLTKSAMGAKWARYSYEQEKYKKNIIEKLDDLKAKFTEALYEKKKTAILKQTINDSMIKIEAEALLKKTTEYKNIQKEIQDQDDIIRFIAEAKQIISQMTWDIKNAIDVLKLENI